MRNAIRAAIALILVGPVASAQPTRDEAQTGPRGSPVTILLNEDFPRRSLAAVVHRRSSAVDRDLIVVDRSAVTPALLSAAVSAVLWLRETQASTSRPVEIYFTKGALLPPSRYDGEWLQSTIASLLQSTPRSVPGIGRSRAITITVPPKASRPRAGRWQAR